MSPHTASQKYSFEWRHASFPASSPSLSPLQGLQPWQFPQNTGSKEEPLLTTPLYSELHLHTFPRICWRSREWRKVRVVVDRPRLCRAASVDANVEGLKNSNTHQQIAKAIFFSFDAPSSRTLKLKKAPLGPSLFSSSMPPPESGSPFSSALRFSIVVSCNLQAEASVTGRERAAAWSISKEVFFLGGGYFRKKLRARATRNKENNNSGLTKISHLWTEKMCICAIYRVPPDLDRVQAKCQVATKPSFLWWWNFAEILPSVTFVLAWTIPSQAQIRLCGSFSGFHN